MANNIFDLNRCYNLFVRQVIFNAKSILLTSLALAGPITLLSYFFTNSFNFSLTTASPVLIFILFAGGYIFSSKVFWELQSQQKSYSYLTLPVSNYERLFVAWFLSSPLYVFVYTLFLSLLYFVFSSTSSETFEITKLLSLDYMNSVIYYMCTQTVFLAGAIYFRGKVFVKTILTIFCFQCLLMLAGSIIGSYFFEENGVLYSFEKFNELYPTLNNIPYLFSLIIGIFFLFVTYVILKKRKI